MRRELTVFGFIDSKDYHNARDYFSREYGSGYLSNCGWTFNNMNNTITIFTDIADPLHATMYCKTHGGTQFS